MKKERTLTMLVDMNGTIVDEADAHIGVRDQGFLYGDGCYETIGVTRGVVAGLDEHLDRLERSARMLRIRMPIGRTELRDRLLHISSVNEVYRYETAAIRIMLTRGVGSGALGDSYRAGPPTLALFARSGSETLRLDDGEPAEIPALRAITSTYTRQLPSTLDPRVKTLNYLTSVLAGLEAHDRGAQVAFLRDPDGYIAEGNVTNVFCVQDGRVLTPAVGNGLAGITRGQVLDAARKLGIECSETRLTSYDLACADEVFVTASTLNLCGISRIDDLDLPTPVPGDITRAINVAHLEAIWRDGVMVPIASAPVA